MCFSQEVNGRCNCSPSFHPQGFDRLKFPVCVGEGIRFAYFPGISVPKLYLRMYVLQVPPRGGPRRCDGLQGLCCGRRRGEEVQGGLPRPGQHVPGKWGRDSLGLHERWKNTGEKVFSSPNLVSFSILCIGGFLRSRGENPVRNARKKCEIAVSPKIECFARENMFSPPFRFLL